MLETGRRGWPLRHANGRHAVRAPRPGWTSHLSGRGGVVSKVGGAGLDRRSPDVQRSSPRWSVAFSVPPTSLQENSLKKVMTDAFTTILDRGQLMMANDAPGPSAAVTLWLSLCAPRSTDVGPRPLRSTSVGAHGCHPPRRVTALLPEARTERRFALDPPNEATLRLYVLTGCAGRVFVKMAGSAFSRWSRQRSQPAAHGRRVLLHNAAAARTVTTVSVVAAGTDAHRLIAGVDSSAAPAACRRRLGHEQLPPTDPLVCAHPASRSTPPADPRTSVSVVDARLVRRRHNVHLLTDTPTGRPHDHDPTQH